MSSVKFTKPVTHLGRTGHDLSSVHAFSMRPALLRPVVFQHVAPDSAFRINCADLVRTSALQTAAFLRGKHELDFFFVPYSLLYKYFDSIVFTRGDYNSSYEAELAEKNKFELPILSLGYLIHNAHFPWFVNRLYRWLLQYWEQIPNTDRENFVLRLSDFLRACYFVYSGSQDGVSNLDYLFEIVFYDMLPAIQTDRFDDALSLNFIGSDVFGLLDMARYGNYLPTFEALFDFVVSHPSEGLDETIKAFVNTASGAGQGDLVSLFEGIFQQFVSAYISVYSAWMNRFVSSNGTADRLEKITFSVNGGQLFEKDSHKVNVLPFLAYQKIFVDRYRDTINDDVANYYNSLEYDVSDSYFLDCMNSLCPLRSWLRPRTRMLKKDMFTSVYPSAQFGEVSFGVTTMGSDENSADNYSGADIWEQLNLPNIGESVNKAGQSSAVNIRFTLALQKFKETLLRAGDRRKDLMKAMFGVESSYINDNYVRYLGSFSGSLDLNKVSATADTGTYSVGDLAANVFSSLSGDMLNVTCNDYGLIVGVMSFIPEILYNSYGMSRFNLKSRAFDFYQAAFENLGLAPMSTTELSVINQPGSGTTVLSMPHVYGYTARNFEYKENPDLAHDSFGTAPYEFNFNSADATLIYNNSADYSLNLPVIGNDGFNSNYVVTRDLYASLRSHLRRNYLMPNCMDSLFRSLDDGLLESYHFDLILDCQISAVLPMSQTGL